MQEYLRSLSSCSSVIHFAIYTRNNSQHIGNVSLNHIHWQARTAEIGILIGNKDFWNKGVASQVITLIVEYAFDRLNLNRLEIGSFNPAAIRVFEKTGFIHEGVSREKIYIDGKYFDDVRMALLASDYYE